MLIESNNRGEEVTFAAYRMCAERGREATMHVNVRRVVALAVLTLGLMAGDAGRSYREGKEFADRGQDYEAVMKYIEALDANDDHKKAREGLLSIAKDAYNEKLAEAEGYEADKAYPSALVCYRELKSMADKVKGHGGPALAAADLNKKIVEMADGAAEERYQEGEKAVAAGRFEDAIAAYEKALTYVDAYKDTQDKIANAAYLWAESDLAAKRYRMAAQHFELAVAEGGSSYKDARARGSAVYRALGLHHTSTGACRQAVKDLRTATSMSPEKVPTQEVLAAETCATTPIAVLPFENPTGQNLVGIALGDAIADGMAAKVRTNGSQFVKLLERAALDQVLAEQGLSAAALAGTAPKVKGVRYLVLGKLTQVKLDRPKESVATQTIMLKEPYDCMKTKNDGTQYKSTCWNDIAVNYLEHTGTASVTLVGTVRVTDVTTGELVTTKTLDVTKTDTVHYADKFTTASGATVTLSERGRTGGIDAPDDLLALRDARQVLATDDVLVHDAIEAVTDRATEAVLAVVDVEKPFTDPTVLTLQ